MGRKKKVLSVFINCPFDDGFLPILRAMLFTVCAMGCKPTSALEESDASNLRLSKIYELIGECRFSIHDLSRTELTPATGLPRFNMPIELGIFLGAKHFAKLRKSALIFVKARDVLSFASDLNGMDPIGHGDDPEKVIEPIRHWLSTDGKIHGLPASVILKHYRLFEADLPMIIERLRYQPGEAKYGDILKILRDWLNTHPVDIPASTPITASASLTVTASAPSN
jgi:hypothetical protein